MARHPDNNCKPYRRNILTKKMAVTATDWKKRGAYGVPRKKKKRGPNP
jgi:hypothetical protein